MLRGLSLSNSLSASTDLLSFHSTSIVFPSIDRMTFVFPVFFTVLLVVLFFVFLFFTVILHLYFLFPTLALIIDFTFFMFYLSLCVMLKQGAFIYKCYALLFDMLESLGK